MEQALFGAGCFWGVQYYIDQIPGVERTIVGYSGGTTENPSYSEVCTQSTGHAETVLVEFNASRVDYETLCRHFFKSHDPTQLNRQGPDQGTNYRSVIFYVNEYQKQVAEKVRDEVQKVFDLPVVTQIEPAGAFYPAEAEHQKYTERTGKGQCHIEYQPITQLNNHKNA